MARRKKVQNAKVNQHQELLEKDVIQPNAIKQVKSIVEFEAKNFQQKRLEKALNTNAPFVFTTGPAGTGKTYVAARHAILKLLRGDVDKIFLTRPTIEAGDSIGFLPGNIDSKMEPWMLPIYDIFLDEGGINKRELTHLIKDGKIEVCPFQFMRGRTIKNAVLIADEMQNSEISQLKLLMTRIGENAQIIINGDIEQSDRRQRTKSGLEDFLDRLKDKNIDGIEVVKFLQSDIVRHPIIEKILDLYDE